MKSMISMGILAALLFFSGCARLPTQQEMKKSIAHYKLPHESKKGHGVVYIVRPSFLGGAVRFNVFLDDQEDSSEMGWNRGSQFFYFYAKPGKHTIHSKAENWAEIKVDVKKDRPVFIKQDASMGFLFARNSLKRVSTTEGTYHVKTLQPGETLKKIKGEKVKKVSLKK